MTGSIKDRMALHILQQGYARGAARTRRPIVEATSGNTGISIAGIGRALGHPVTIFMPDWMSRERIDLIRSLGFAEIHLVSRERGGSSAASSGPRSSPRRQPGAFLPRQFSNEDNVAAHETTGPEIWWQLRYHGLEPDAFVAGVGTGGTIMGVGRFLRQMHPRSDPPARAGRTPRRCPPGTRWASTASRASPTSSSRRSSTSTSSTRWST